MKRRRDDAVANGAANVRAADVVANTIDPLLVLGGLQLVDNAMSPEHGFEIAIRRPNTMHAMLGGKFSTFDLCLSQARKATTNVIVRFEDEGFQSTLGEVDGGGEPGNSPANDDDVVFVHWG